MSTNTASRILLAALAASLAGALTATPAFALKDYKRGTAEDAIYDQHAFGVRYPGDVHTPVGNYHERGGRKIPYIERCHWTFDLNDIGLPKNLRQVCRRYYGEPLKAR